VLDELDAAKRAYDVARAAIGDAEQALIDAKTGLPAARQRLHEAIVAAARAGVRQVDIAERSGYRRERIRQICRSAGLDPSAIE
jgi:hypothetical protein